MILGCLKKSLKKQYFMSIKTSSISIPFLFLICFLFSISVFSQNTEELEKYKKMYPNEGSVRLLQETIYRLQLEKNEIKITKEVFEQDLFLNENATYNTKRSLSYSTFIDLEKIEASTLSPSEGSYKEIPVKEFNRKNDLDESFYDDSKRVSFLFPNLGKGSKTNFSYTYNIKNPRFLSPFFFGDFSPILKTKVTIIADKKIDLSFKEFNTDSLNIVFEKKKKGNNNIYSWTASNEKAYNIDPGAPSYQNFLPHIVPIIKSYKTNNGKVEVLNKVKDLYNWYYSLVEEVNKEASNQELTDLVNEITKDKASDLDKVKAIYYWTQKNIKYIAFEYALGGFIPREANDVFKKKYGDCKDNSSILYKMLEIAGLKGHLTWIGTRKIPYTYEEMPTPMVDNHMILSYENNGKTYYLDATGRYTKIEYPSAFIQGKEALVSYGKDSFQIKKVPVIPAKMNQLIDSTFINIQGKKLIGSSNTYVSGYPLNDFYYRLEGLKKDSEIKAFYNSKMSKGNNSFLISSFKEHNKFSYEKDFKINYDFTVQNYVQNIGSEIFINPHLNRFISELKTKKDRKYPVEYEYKKKVSYTNIFTIPDGFKVDYIPENIEYKNDLTSR
jgi:transglutaminase-like putative cysteine protease